MKTSLLPRYDNTNGWLRTLPPLPAANKVDGIAAFDYVVIGRGYGGLAAARRLGELAPDASVALVEAGRIGNNTAGRCSGFIIDHAHNIRAKGFADDTENARRGIAANRAGLDWLRTIVEANDIECDWRDEGKIHAAASPNGVRMLSQFAESLDAVDEEYEMLDSEQLRHRFGTNFYDVGLLAPTTALVQPVSLVIGLAQSMPSNVAVFENSPIVDYTFGPPHRFGTPHGEIKSPSVVLAANGFGEGFGFFTKHLLPLITWGSMTRKLTEDELERLGGDESYGIIPAHPAGTTVRRLSSGRILIRNQYTYRRTSDVTKGKAAVAEVHRRSFRNRFPMLSDVDFEYTWGGAFSLSRNGAGVCGRLQTGVWATMVYQGTGIAKGTISGKYVAESLMGQRPALLDVLTANSSPGRNVPEPFNGWGVGMNIRWRRWQAGIEE